MYIVNMIAGKSKSKIKKKDILCQCKRRFDEKEFNSDQCWNNDKCLCEFKKRHVWEKDYISNPTTW